MHLSDNMFGVVVLLSHWWPIVASVNFCSSFFVLLLFSSSSFWCIYSSWHHYEPWGKVRAVLKSNAIKLIIIRSSVQHARPREKLVYTSCALNVAMHSTNFNSFYALLLWRRLTHFRDLHYSDVRTHASQWYIRVYLTDVRFILPPKSSILYSRFNIPSTCDIFATRKPNRTLKHWTARSKRELEELSTRLRKTRNMKRGMIEDGKIRLHFDLYIIRIIEWMKLICSAHPSHTHTHKIERNGITGRHSSNGRRWRRRRQGQTMKWN